MLNNPLSDSYLDLLEQHKGIIYKVTQAYTRELRDREDLQQEIAFQLWRAWPQYSPRFKVSTWVYRIALNVAISFVRKSARRPKSLAAEDAKLLTLQSTDHQEAEEQHLWLHRFIDELNHLDKAVILLYLDDWPQQDIADTLGLSLTNVSTKINRIKNQLKQKFKTINK